MEIPNCKKVKMRVVEIYSIALIAFCFSCGKHDKSIQPLLNGNEGGYQYSFKPTDTTQQELLIEGFVYALDTQEPLPLSTINFYCQTFETDENGYFTFLADKDLTTPFYLSVSSLGYKKIETHHLSIKKNSILHVFFYLDTYNHPIFHCE